MHPLLSLINTFDQDNHTRGIQFEKLCKWILENHPLYKTKLKKVWLWDDWPERWGRDCGIDLVAVDVDGKTWAVQAKCYDPKNTVTKKDIDSFLSESANSKIHHRLLIATTDSIGANARAVIGRQNETIPISQMMLSNLLEAPLEWPKSIDELAAATVKKAFKPKPYQQKAIDNVVQNLDSRGQLIMACGTGKTLTGLWINEKLNSNLTLVLLPSLLLLSKTLTEWLTHCKEPFSYLPVCSDDTVAKSEDAINLSTAELSFPTTTDADDIAKFVQGEGRKVIFSTYQSSEKIAEAFKFHNLEAIDLVIADEAHRCSGKADSVYSIVLDNQQLPAAKRLFMTATPRIFQSKFKKKAAESGVEVMSMDDEAVFGPVLHKLSFGEAIEQDLLTDYQVVVVGINNSLYSAMIDERKLVKTDTDIHSDAQSLASHIGLAKAIKNYDLRRVISFHSRVSSARDFANQLPEVIEWMPKKSRPDGELITDYVSGAMPTNERDKNLRALGDIADNQRYILSNARCLSEGVDVPALDGIAFVDPRNSEIDIVQAVGRAIRLSKGKALGSIVIPVFLEDNDDVDEVLSSSPFKKVWAVINALRAHDDDLSNALDQLRYKLGRRGIVGKPDKIVFDLPTTISHDFEEALNTRLIESTTASWKFWYGLLERFFIENGHCKVIEGYITEDGHNLSNWVGVQRSNKDIISMDRVQLLDKIGFIWDVYEDQWSLGFDELKIYKDKHGNCSPVANYVVPSTKFKLGKWVYTQRNNKPTMSPDRIRKLNDLGFVWSVTKDTWKKGMKELEMYVKSHGDLAVNQSYISPSGFDLGNWVNTLRYPKNPLKAERKAELDKIGFIWNIPEHEWEVHYKALLTYRDDHGDCLVNYKYICPKTQLELGKWVRSKRRSRNLGKMDEAHERLLDKIDFIWDEREYIWDKSFKALENYKKLHGDCLVPSNHVSDCGVKLGSWVSTQRKNHKKGEISAKRTALLNSLKFVWNTNDYEWMASYKLLKQYKAEYGNSNVAQKYNNPPYLKLGYWVSTQRQNKSKLSQKRLKLLEEVGFVWTGK
jgi:superfamily II DNA or RNA helicase